MSENNYKYWSVVAPIGGTWDVLATNTRDNCKAYAIKLHNDSHGAEIGIMPYIRARRLERENVEIDGLLPDDGYIPAFRLIPETSLNPRATFISAGGNSGG